MMTRFVSLALAPTLARGRVARRLAAGVAVASLSLSLAACNAVDSFLSVPPPAGQQTGAALEGKEGAEGVFNQGRALFRAAYGADDASLLMVTDILSDAYHVIDVYGGSGLNLDARRTAGNSIPGGFLELGDAPLAHLYGARSELLKAVEVLPKYEPDSALYRVGEAYALIAYTELFIAENYCAGATLDRTLLNDGIEYGQPLTTDSLLGVAEAHFDSALAHAHGSAAVRGLASIGLGRARIGRGNASGAAAAVAGVATSFAYTLQYGTDYGARDMYYHEGSPSCYTFQLMTMSDNEGTSGLNYVSANDPRLPVQDSLCEHPASYLGYAPYHKVIPLKYPADITALPFATGIEARLIEAEAALRSGDPSWLTTLNALRTTCTGGAGTCATPAPAGSGQVAGLPPLADPGVPDSSIKLLFRERAFWLFGQGSRLGDMRRMVRLYHLPADNVFPRGNFPNGAGPQILNPILTYGTDIALTLPTPEAGASTTNPYYRGCIDATT